MDVTSWADCLRKESGIAPFASGPVDRNVASYEHRRGERLRAFGDADRIYGSQGNLPKFGGRFSFHAERPSSPSSVK